jgi:GNAT superfamily N-acetyltransferase
LAGRNAPLEQPMLKFAVSIFDPHSASRELWAAFHAHERAMHAELWPGEPLLSDAEREHEMLREMPHFERARWVALSEGEVIGFAGASYRKADAPYADEHAPHMFANGAVRARARRQGVGSALLREALALMHRLGKTVLTAGAHTEPGHAFLINAGAVAKHSSVEARAMLNSLAWDALREWEDAAGGCGLAWERYAGRVPRERLISLLPEFSALFADAPMGELEMAPLRFEIEDYEQWYETMERTGGADHLVMLIAPDGRVAGMSEAMWDARTPGAVYQQLTATAREWRGRGVAKALKAALLRQVRESHGQAEYISTGNGEENAAMRGINERIGFKAHRRFVQYQAARDALDAWSARTE